MCGKPTVHMCPLTEPPAPRSLCPSNSGPSSRRESSTARRSVGCWIPIEIGCRNSSCASSRAQRLPRRWIVTSRLLIMRRQMACIHPASCACCSRTRPSHVHPSAAAAHGVVRASQLSTWLASSLRSMPVLQCGQADGSWPIATSATRLRIGSSGSRERPADGAVGGARLTGVPMRSETVSAEDVAMCALLHLRIWDG